MLVGFVLTVTGLLIGDDTKDAPPGLATAWGLVVLGLGFAMLPSI